MNTAKIKTLLADLIEILIIGVAVFALAWIFLAEPLEVTGDSMAPTLHNAEQIIVEKVSMNFGELNTGDIVVFNSPENPNILIVKRIIGTPGDKVLIENNEVFVNGEKLEEAYLTSDTFTETKNNISEGVPMQVKYNSYFVLGDNRTNSSDSRDFGLITKDEIIGKAVFVYFPFDSSRKLTHSR